MVWNYKPGVTRIDSNIWVSLSHDRSVEVGIVTGMSSLALLVGTFIMKSH